MEKDGWEGAAARAYVEALVAGDSALEMSPADRAMLDYAIKLTRTPQRMTQEDVDALRKHGFDDRAVHDICCVTAYFAFVNRVADGLGVELEADWQQRDD